MLLLLPALLFQAHTHPAPEAVPALIEVANTPIAIRDGIGAAHDHVTTTSRAAQGFYDQGLACLHSFMWLDAARSFNRAIALDPRLAIAHVQLSIAYTELNLAAAAKSALAAAQTLSTDANDHDRTHVMLRSVQMTAEEAPRDSTRLAAYRAALDAALRKYPQDEELWLARGLAESVDPAERGQGSGASSIEYYETAVTLGPNHFAAHHYLAHAYENGGRIAGALEEATTYSRMAPGVPHARHMRGHDLRRSGRIADAITEFAVADSLARRSSALDQIPIEYDWHYQHNLDLLATSHQYLGHAKQAEALFKTAFAIHSSSVEQEFNKREWPMFLLARGRVDEALAAARSMAGHRSPIVSAEGHVLAGEALLALGRFNDAADEANAALRLMRASPEGAGMVADSLQALQGAFLLKTGQREKGRGMLEDVVRKLRAATGPDVWTQAIFAMEAVARTARDAGDWALAAQVADRLVEHDPNYPGAYYAKGLVAEHEGDRPRARAAFVRAANGWKTADPDLAELQIAQQRRIGK